MNNFINKIYNIDARKLIKSLSNIPNLYIISDPPYNQKYHYSGYDDNLKQDEYKGLLYTIFSNKKAVIIHYPEETINILAQSKLGRCKQVVSWIYNSNTAKQYRLITWWNYKPDMRKVGQDYKNPNDKRIKKRIAEGKMARLYDWWYINQVKNVSKKNNIHSCPVPLELMERIIKITTNKNDIIYDPFMGSGTTALACIKTGRKFIGSDISKLYCQVANERIKKCKKKISL